MRRFGFFLFTIGICLLTACSDSGTGGETFEIRDGSARLLVRRGEFNQTAIKIVDAGGMDADLVLARRQGYEQARERFFQMDISRRVSRGRLGELFGQELFDSPDNFLSDINIWALGLVEATDNAEQRLRAHHPRAIELLEAFAEGVNRYLAEAPVEQPELIETYRRITRSADYLPAAWEPADSLAIATQMAFLLSSSLTKKATIGTMYMALLNGAELDPAKIEKLIDLRPLENVFILPTDATAPSAADAVEDRRETENERIKRKPRLWEALKSLLPKFAFICPQRGTDPLGGSCGGLDVPGSNNWVVSRAFAGGTKSYLANDPHLSLHFPSTFGEVALDSVSAGGTLYLRGVTPAGLMGILIGHNRDIAWGFTNSMSDVDDIYAERFHPENENLVRQGKQWIDVVKKPRTFLVRQPDGSVKEVTRALRFVPNHGPIITDYVAQFKAVSSVLPGTGFSYKWTGHAGTTEFVALMSLSRARDFAEFKTALKHFEAGAQNIVYADTKGNIGYYSHGLYPKRPYLEKEGAAPPFVPEMSYGKNEWEGFRQNVPELYNPEKGYIVTANNDPYGYNAKPNLSGYKDYFGFRFAPGSRAKRIEDMIQTLKSDDGELTLEDNRRIQFDHVDLISCRVVGLLEVALPNLTLSEAEKALADQIVGWKADGCLAKRNSLAMPKVTLWMAELIKAYYGWLKEDLDRNFASLGEAERNLLFANFIGSSFGLETVYHKSHEALAEGTEAVNTQFETSLKNARQAIDDRELGDLRWGEVHALEFVNLFKGVIPTLPHPQLERDGSLGTVDMGGFDVVPEIAGLNGKALRLPNEWGPNFRLIMVLEEGKPISGYNVLPGGTTSSLQSQGALRELLMWRDGGQRPLVSFIE